MQDPTNMYLINIVVDAIQLPKPKLYEGYFNNQIAKQSSAAVGAAISNGKTSIEVNLPSVPNLEEVRFGYVL